MNKEKDLSVVRMMIELYCHKLHGTKKHELCPNCEELYKYVELRRSKCPFGDDKPFCANCRIHCYKPDKREEIREVMRFSGPRIVFHHPIVAFKHLAETTKEKRKMAKEDKLKAQKENNQK